MKSVAKSAKDGYTQDEREQYWKIRLDAAGFHHAKGSEFRSKCILHGGDNPNSLCVNSETGAFYCFSCHAGGHGVFAFEQELLRRESSSGQAPESGRVAQSIREILGTPFSERVYAEDIGGKSSGGGWDRKLAQNWYPYTDELGYETYRVWRFVDAKGNKKTPPDHACPCARDAKAKCEPGCVNGRVWGLGKTRRVLYRLLDVIQSLLVFIVEGEKNVNDLSRALALYISMHGGFRLGNLILDRVAVTCNVGGSGGWKAEYGYGRSFANKVVVKLSDNDLPGKKHEEAVCKDVFPHAHQLFTLDLPVGGGEDISDYLKNHTIDDLIRLLGSDRRLYTLPSRTIGPEVVCLADVEAKPVPWLWRPYLAFGMLAMLSGDPSAGKTFIALAIAADLSNGKVPVTGEKCEPVHTLYLSHENSPEHVIRPRFDAQGGNPNLFHILRGSISGEDDAAVRAGITLKDVAILDAALVQTGARFAVIDPVQSFLGAEIDAHRSNETRPVMDGLIALAEKHNACILIVRHLAKTSGGRAIHRGLGSIDLTGAVRTEMLAGTAPDDPDNRALVQIKNNLGPQADSLGYQIVGANMEAKLEWLGKSDLTAGDLLAPEVSGDAPNEEEKAERIVRGVAKLRTEIARRITAKEPPILKAEAESFLMRADFRQRESRSIIESDCFEPVPRKGKGGPLELRCRIHSSSDDKNAKSTNVNKDAGADGVHFCHSITTLTTEINPPETSMDKGDLQSAHFCRHQDSLREPSFGNGALTEVAGPLQNGHNSPSPEVERLAERIVALVQSGEADEEDLLSHIDGRDEDKRQALQLVIDRGLIELEPTGEATDE